MSRFSQKSDPLANYNKRLSMYDDILSEQKILEIDLLPNKPPRSDSKYRDYTLVLDLDETLVHFDARKEVYKIRPLCLRFLQTLAPDYEIVIFTAAHQTYADFILDKLDPEKKVIMHRLYR